MEDFDNDDLDFPAAQTLKAGRWELLMARLFGAKSIGRDGLFEVEIRQWRGKYYLVRASHIDHGDQQ